MIVPKPMLAEFGLHDRLENCVYDNFELSGRDFCSSVPFDMVSAGDHCDLRMSKQMLPLELMFG